jgi:hypothetical protein
MADVQTIQLPIEKDKKTNNDLQGTSQKIKDWTTRTPPQKKIPQKTGGKHVLRKGQQFLFHQLHPSCYSC